ncbi:MAG: class I SAM-dependent DNA methyltransferase [Hoeflea sp.]|uniref:class I SAM-dependent DNA methyltransferase n=1 Tax=Hoeflea sp. TaxID=1940281 RepID=UPI003EF3FAB6
MSEDWNEHAENWDTNPGVKLYAEKAFASLVTHTDIRDESWKSKRVLDFGCGTGSLAELISPYVKEVVAVDTSEKMIAGLKEKGLPNVTTVHADILDINFQHERSHLSDFDLVYASSVCSFLCNYEDAVCALARTLKRGGYFMQWDWLASDDDGFGLTENQMSNALKRARFSSFQIEPAFVIQAEGQTMPVLLGVGVW